MRRTSTVISIILINSSFLFFGCGQKGDVGAGSASGSTAGAGGDSTAPGTSSGDASIPKPEVIENSLKMKLVLIPPGEFDMGSPEGEKLHNAQEKLHHVRLTKGFYLGMYEVTQKEYRQLMEKNPSHYSDKGEGKSDVQGLDAERLPVENVTWDDAKKFCFLLSQREYLLSHQRESKTYRLPTEAEWEYACRAGTKTAFHFGDKLNGTEANCNGSQPYGTTVRGKYLKRPTTVGSYPPNAFGLFDMHGNVWEFTSDELGDYEADAVDPVNRASNNYGDHVIRGGSWGHNPAFCRSATRGVDGRSVQLPGRANNIGFRVVRER